MNNLVRSVLLAGTLLTTSLQGLHADTKSQVSGTQNLVSASLNKKSQIPIITTEDLKSPHPPEKFKNIVAKLLESRNDGSNISILIEGSSSNSDIKGILANWLKEMGALENDFFRYLNKKDKKGNTINVVNTLRDAIANFSTRVIIITDKKGDDWKNLQEISGVEIVTFFINGNELSCKITKYENNENFPKGSRCIDVK